MLFPVINKIARVAAGLTMLGSAYGIATAAPTDVTPYLLPTCPVSGSELGAMGEPASKVYDGKEVKFCCGGCPAKYEADRAKYDAQIEGELIASQTPHYPLDTCVVSGEKLGSMGDPVDYVDGNALVRLCCKGCVSKLEKSGDEFRRILEEATIDKQKSDYPLDTCVVSGEKLGGAMGDPVEFVAGNRLIRLCCKSCTKDAATDPATYIHKIDEAKAGTVTKDSEHSRAHHKHDK